MKYKNTPYKAKGFDDRSQTCCSRRIAAIDRININMHPTAKDSSVMYMQKQKWKSVAFTTTDTTVVACSVCLWSVNKSKGVVLNYTSLLAISLVY